MKLFTLLCLLLLSSCATTQKNTTLYEDMGGEESVEIVVDNFITEIGFDKDVYSYFAESDIERFREKMTEHLCHLTDGPCEYTGDSMIDVHTNMDVTESSFNRVVDMVYTAMQKAGLSESVQNRVIGRLAPLREEIVYR